MSAAIGHPGLDAMSAALEGGELPSLGYVVLYEVGDVDSTLGELSEWFDELGLDPGFLPNPQRQCDAYERVTSSSGTVKYDTSDDPETADPGCGITLMIRHVRRVRRQNILRHLVREVRDPENEKLRYDAHLADLAFEFTPGDEDDHGTGAFDVTLDDDELAKLTPYEAAAVKTMLTAIRMDYENRCAFIDAAKVRAMVRNYIASLNPIKLKSSGGVYFVGREHTATLTGLAELLERFTNDNTNLMRLPLIDVVEARDLLTSSLITQTHDRLQSLSVDLAAAQAAGVGPDKRVELHQRFVALKTSLKQHGDRFSVALTDIDGTLTVTEQQITALLADAPTEEGL